MPWTAATREHDDVTDDLNATKHGRTQDMEARLIGLLARGNGWRSLICLVAMLPMVGCDDSSSSGSTAMLQGDTACAKWQSLSAAKSCGTSGCTISAECDAVARAWIECAARDLSQCYCESGDGKLNCEGSFKANEGPALCMAEFDALDVCQRLQEPDASSAAGVGG